MAKRTWCRKGKEGKWYVILTVPVREAGVIVRKRKEHGTGCHRKADAEKVANEIEADYHEAARTNQAPGGSDTTFADAVVLYIQNNPNPNEAYYLEPIVEEIGDLTLDKLTQAEVQRVTQKLKGHCKPNTQARHIYDPIQAVYNYAVKAGLASPRKFQKPKGWNQHKRVMSPPDEWYKSVMPHLNRRFYALMLLLVTHGLRISEALKCTPGDIDDEISSWRLNLPEYDKAGNPVQVVLAPAVIEAIEAMPNWREREHLFGTKNRHNVKRAVKRACEKAGVKFYGSHAWGRHKANRIYLDGGGSLKGTMQAFRWKSPRMPLMHYGHEETSEITAQVHRISSEWLDNLESQNSEDGTNEQPGVGRANLGQIEQTAQSAPRPRSKKQSKSGNYMVRAPGIEPGTPTMST